MYVYCSKCNTLVANRYCHMSKNHFKYYITRNNYGYTSKFMKLNDHAKVLPVEFNLADIDSIAHVLHP
jgi:hypothetical protein